jgi:hypothetical protein
VLWPLLHAAAPAQAQGVPSECPQTFVVTNLADAGPGTLRQTILDANACPGSNAITLAVTSVIDLLSALPSLEEDVGIFGPGASQLTVQRSEAEGTPGFRLFTIIGAGVRAEIAGLTLRNGQGQNDTLLGRDFFGGGAIRSEGVLTVRECVLAGNSCPPIGFGGALLNQGEMWVVATIIRSNSATLEGGGIYNGGEHSLHVVNSTLESNRAGAGGGVLNAGFCRVTGTTLNGNRADSQSGGGAIFNFANLVLTNCTLSGNAAEAGSGGAVFSWNEGPVVIRHSTIVSNSAAVEGGGLHFLATNPAFRRDLVNTIVARNTAPVAPDVRGSLTASGHNVFSQAEVTGSTATDSLGLDPELGPLADNGGPTWTHAPLASSPAIDAGDNTGAPETDQRGLPRIVNGIVDIGAVEEQQPLPPIMPTIVCPGDVVVPAEAGRCTAVVAFEARASGRPVPVVECRLDGTLPIRSPHVFAVGTNRVTCTAANAGGSAHCSFTVTVFSAEPPEVFCPPDQMVMAEPGDSSAYVDRVAVASGCVSGNAVLSLLCDLPPDLRYPIGSTTVHCVAMDSFGRSNACSFTVTVLATEGLPRLFCPDQLTVTNEPGACSALVASPVTVIGTPEPVIECAVAGMPLTWPHEFTVGTHAVSCTASNVVGTTNCSFTVTVLDGEAPQLICPASLVLSNGLGPTGGVVNFDVTASDNCPGVEAPLCVPPSGSTLPVGSTRVECSVRDAAGNVATCSFDATVGFFLGINLGGRAVTIEGNQWLAYTQALGGGLTVEPAVNVTERRYSFPLVPPVDADTRTVLESVIWRDDEAGTNFTLLQSVPSGSYQVCVWAVENHADNFRRMNLRLQGEVAATNIGDLPLGHWRKHGPFDVFVTNGTLRVDVERAGKGDISLAGLTILSHRGRSNAPPTVALVEPASGAEFPEGTSVTLRAEVSDDGSVSVVEFFEGANKLGEDFAPPFEFTVTGLAAGEYTFTAAATDTVGARGTSGPVRVTITPLSGLEFVLGINLGGQAVTIEGNPWLGHAEALANGLSVSAVIAESYSYSFPLNPAADADTRAVLESVVWRPAPNGQGFTLGQPLSNGVYHVFLWLVENYQDNYRNVEVRLEGNSVAVGLADLPLGYWRKYGPFVVPVADGALEIEILRVTKGDPLLCGLAIFADTNAEAPAPVPPQGTVVEVTDPTPRIVLLARSEQGPVYLKCSGPIGASYRVQTSDELNQWQEIGAGTIRPTGTSEFIDVSAKGQAHRFYRLIAP